MTINSAGEKLYADSRKLIEQSNEIQYLTEVLV